MRVEPGDDGAEIVFDGADVEQRAGGVAVVKRAVEEVRLALQDADAVVKLLRYRVLLVGSGVVGARAGRVVGGDFGDFAVFAGTEGCIVVEGLELKY